MGGTEATVIRIMKALSKNHDITIEQSRREASMTDNYGIKYRPYSHRSGQRSGKINSVVVIRSNKILLDVRRQYPDANLFLWMHCFPGKHHKRLNDIACQTSATIITVSDTHKKDVYAFLNKYRNHRSINGQIAKVIRIYNPVNEFLRPDGSSYDPNKLVYFSSPHKGLPQVLETFGYIRKSTPDLRLYVANPGYMWMKNFPNLCGVINLGSLPHYKIIQHVRESLCVFYPQSHFRETFGLVFAEANAVGTPVLAHDLGSTPEILKDRGQLVNTEDKEEVRSTIDWWRRNGRPKVDLRNELRCSQVVKQWEQFLTGVNNGENNLKYQV